MASNHKFRRFIGSLCTMAILTGIGCLTFAAVKAGYKISDESSKAVFGKQTITPESREFAAQADELLKRRASTLTAYDIEKGLAAYHNFPVPSLLSAPANMTFQLDSQLGGKTPFYDIRPTNIMRQYDSRNGKRVTYTTEGSECTQLSPVTGEEGTRIVGVVKAKNSSAFAGDGELYMLRTALVVSRETPKKFQQDYSSNSMKLGFKETMMGLLTGKSDKEVADDFTHNKLRGSLQTSINYSDAYYDSIERLALVYVSGADGSITCYDQTGQLIARTTKPAEKKQPRPEGKQLTRN